MICASLQDVAETLRVDPDTITSWRKKGCPELAGDGPYDSQKVAMWKATSHKPGRKRKPEVAPEGELSEAQKHKRAQRIKTEMEIEVLKYKHAIEKGELVHVGDTEQALMDQATIFRRELLAIKDHWADSMIGLATREDAQEQLTRISTDILGRLSKGDL